MNSNTPPKNFYQAQPFSQPPVPGYPYNYMPPNPDHSNGQAYNPAYQYWNYYQYQQPNQNYYQQPPPQPYNNSHNQWQRDQRNYNNNNQGKNNFNNRNNNLQNQKNFNRNRGPNDQVNRNFQNQNKKAKNKIDKRDLPENNKYYCEVCDRGFKTDDKYQEHLATHTTCGVNGCKFRAAEKLVEIHFRNFHATGLDKKVASLQTPEEIQKYINERKKNFPSKQNLVKKESIDQEKSDRGVVLDTRQFGRFKNKNKRNFDKCKSNERNKENEAVGSEDNVEPMNKKSRQNKRNKKGLFSRKIEVLKNRYKKPTLLQKLLADEIRHERNILLQCVRYVVQQNFFDQPKIIKMEIQ